MPLYENRDNAENKIKIKNEWKDAIVIGPENVIQRIIDIITEHSKQRGIWFNKKYNPT